MAHSKSFAEHDPVVTEAGVKKQEANSQFATAVAVNDDASPNKIEATAAAAATTVAAVATTADAVATTAAATSADAVATTQAAS